MDKNSSTQDLTINELTDKTKSCLKRFKNIFHSENDKITPVGGELKPKPYQRITHQNVLFVYIEKLTAKDSTEKVLAEIDKHSQAKSGFKIREIFTYKNEYNCNVLHQVCRLEDSKTLNSFEIFKKLRESPHCTVIETNKYGQTILHIASYYNKLDIVKNITQVDQKDLIELIKLKTYEEEQTALHYAAKQGNLTIVELLLKNGADIEAKDYQERTPLFLACEHGRANVAKLLISKNARIEVTNKYGQKCLYWLIAKCPDLAPGVLNKYKKFNTYTKKETYNLKYVELDPNDIQLAGKQSQAKSILSLIVERNNLVLISHPVITRLVKVKWRNFGRRRSYFDLMLTIIYIVVWNLIGALVPYDQRYNYKFPHDGWRIFLFIIGALCMIALFLAEFRELYYLSQYNKRVKNHRMRELEGYGKFTFYQNKQIKFLEDEKDDLKNTQLFGPYAKDFWNWFDIISILLLCACVITHIVDIVDHSEGIARAHIRILAISVIFISIRLLKVGRILNEEFGQLVMTLYFVIGDILVWIITYTIIWIPFSSAFWILFGGTQSTFYDSASNSTISIDSMDTYSNAIFNLYTETFGYDVNRNNMIITDNVLTDPLIGFYLGFTSLITVNIFIALLNSTFSRVHDQSKAHFIMQRAAEVLENEHKMNRADYKKHLESLQKSYEDTKTSSLLLNVDNLKHNLINETIKTIRGKADELDQEINEIKKQLENKPVVPTKPEIIKQPHRSDDLLKVQNEFNELKALISNLIEHNHKERLDSRALLRRAPKVDVLRMNEVNENDISISGLESNLNPLNDSNI